MLFSYPGWSWGSFRLIGMGDQLSYFGEVANGAHGNFAAVEPYTETGINSDPHLYYQVLGAISHVGGIAPADVWNLGGVGLQVLLVACVSVAAVLITRRWWTSFLGVLPFLIGTLSFTSTGWNTSMKRPAVLWGAFVTMFPLNGESASLAVGGMLFLLLLVTATRWPHALMVVGIVVGAGVGLLSGFQTYGYLTALFFAIYGLAIYSLVVIGLRWPAALSVGLFALIFLIGPTFASTFGRLVTLPLGLLPALPGLVIAVRRWRARVVWPLVALIVTSMPQVIGTWISLHDGDAFLKYRQASSAGIGVTWKDGLLCAVPLLVPLVLIVAAGVHRKQPLWIAYGAGCAIAWLLLAKNDGWGTNQEPYRLWIDSFALTAFTVVPIASRVAMAYVPRNAGADERLNPRIRAIALLLGAATVAIGGVSSIDWFRFYKSQENQTYPLSGPVDTAMKVVASRVTGEELIMTDPCIAPDVLKAVTGDRVDAYSRGLAWPARVQQINLVTTTLAKTGEFKSAELKAAGIGWLITDGACSADWPRTYSSLLDKVATSSYGPSPDVISLWRFKST